MHNIDYPVQKKKFVELYFVVYETLMDRAALYGSFILLLFAIVDISTNIKMIVLFGYFKILEASASVTEYNFF